MEHAHRRSWSFALAGIAALSLGGSALAFAIAAGPSADGSDFRAIARIERLAEVGHGTLRWLGLPVYRATLWSGDGRYGAGASQPLALTLAYQHGFSRAQLIDITASEWQRLGLADAALRARWVALLERIWSDVAAGDEISVLVVPAAATRFYHGDRLLGRIEDPAFGPAYLAIWLDARSRVGRLRTELMGPSPGGQP